jgi:hypothetical protein
VFAGSEGGIDGAGLKSKHFHGMLKLDMADQREG